MFALAVAAVVALAVAAVVAMLGAAAAEPAIPPFGPVLGERAAETFGPVPADAATAPGLVGVGGPLRARTVRAERSAPPGLAGTVTAGPAFRPVRLVTPATALAESAAAPVRVATVGLPAGAFRSSPALITAFGPRAPVSARSAATRGTFCAGTSAAVPR
jgi:hypothetical protein